MSAFGDRLRQTREGKGLSLEAVADATRIARRHLAALERSDLAALPTGPFAKGYIEAYAQYLGIDPQPILEAYRSEARRRRLDSPEAQNRVIEELSHLVEQRAGKTGLSGRFPAGWKGVAAVALVAAGVLATAGWLLSRARAPQAPDATSLRARAQAPPDVGVAPEIALPEARTPPQTEAHAPPAAETAPSRPSAQASDSTAVSDAATAPMASSAEAGLRISHSGVGTGVRSHRLVGRADRFVEGTRVAFWTRVLGGRPGDVIRHVWFHEGQAVMSVELPIGGTHWRTYSRHVLNEGATGRWVVEARGPDGQVLVRQEFLCVSDVQ